MIPQLQAGLVRILTSDGELAGVGFLITPRRILCTASSVLAVLGQTVDAATVFEEEITVQFAEEVIYICRIVGWHPSGDGGIFDAAVLELAPNAVIDGNPLRLSVLEDPIDHTFKTLGYGAEKDESYLALGRFVAINPSGYLEVEELEPGESFYLPGFLGAPVWDDRAQAVVGMMNLIDSDQGLLSVVIPLNSLTNAFPDIPIRLPTETPGELNNVPDLPPHFVMRPTEFRKLRAALLAGRQQRTRRGSLTGTTGSMGVTSTGPGEAMRSERIVLQGPPGIGKTSLAAAVVRDEYLRRIYPDGIFWIHLGFTPDLTLTQANLARMVGAPYGAFTDPRQGRRVLRGLLSNKACLLVLDDVWDPPHAASFDCLGPRGMLMIIGPEIGLAGSLRARRLQLGPFAQEEATKLMCSWAGIQEQDYASELPPILSACDNNPLAISLAGAMLDNDAYRWANFIAQIDRLDLAAVLAKMGNFSYQKILAILTLAIKDLPEDVRKLFMELAVFSSGEPVPVTAVQMLLKIHDLDPDTIQEILLVLIRRNLLQSHEDEQGRLEIILHEFISTYLRTYWNTLVPLHQQLLRGYGSLPPENDGWIMDNLVSQLRMAGQIDELRKLLFNYRFLFERLVSCSIDGLLNDYTHALATEGLSLWDRDNGSQELTIVENALRLSAPILAEDPQALPGQLIARLGGYDLFDIQLLVSGAQAKQNFAWMRPLTPSLNYPGSKRLLYLNAHKGKINVLVISLDGREIISAGDDRVIRIWSMDDGHLIRTLRGHDGPVTDLALTPEGLYLISASVDGSIKIWQLSDGVCIQTLSGHEGRVLKLAPTPDGRRLISAGSDYKTLIWNLENGGLIGSFKMHDDWIRALVVLPGSLQAVSASREIKVWDIETGQVMYTLSGHQDKVNGLAVTPDGQNLVSVSDDQMLYIWNLQTGSELRSVNSRSGKLSGLALIPGIYMAVTIADGSSLRTWNLDSGRLVDRQEVVGGKLTAIAVSPTGRKLVSAESDGSISVWDWANRRRLRIMRDHTSRINAVTLLPDGERIVTASSDGSLRIWKLASGRELISLQSQGPGITALTCASDGRRIFSGSEDGLIKLWDLLNQFPPQVINGHSQPVLSLAVTPDGRRLISASADATLNIWDIDPSNGALFGSLALLSILYGHTSWVRGVAALPDNWHAVSVSADRTLKLWDLDNAQIIYSLEYPYGELNDVIVMMNGLQVATAGDDNIIHILDVKTGHPQYRLIGHQGEVNAVAATPDGKRLVSVSHDRTVRVWDIPERSRTRRGGQDDLEGMVIQNSMILEDHTDWVQAVAITSDGRRAVSASDDTTLRQWDISKEGDVSLGARPVVHLAHMGKVISLTFSVDGRYILSSGADQKTRMWMLNRSDDGRFGSICEKIPGRVFPTTSGLSAMFNDGIHFCSTGHDRAVEVWDVEKPGSPVRVIKNFSDEITQIACSPDGRKIGVVEASTIKILGVADGQLLAEFNFPDQKILTIEFMPDLRKISAITADGKLYLLDAVSGIASRPINLGYHNKAVSLVVTKIDSRKNQVAAWTGSGDLVIWDLSNAGFHPISASTLHSTSTSIANPPETVSSLAFASQCLKLGVASGQEFIVYNLEEKDQNPIRFQSDAEIISCAASNLCGFFAAGDRVGNIHFLFLEGLLNP